MMKILFIGDIFGRPGRHCAKELAPKLRNKYNLDFIIANGENSAGGAGITGKICYELHNSSIDAITLGDHVWDQHGFINEIDQINFTCRPLNLPTSNPGRTHLIIEKNNFRLGVFTVLGRTFMKLRAECPFHAADKMIETLKEKVDGIFVEIHAEATSEKEALGHYLAGRVLGVVGTHTHVITGDHKILNGGTAYLTDAGVTGPSDSVLGVDKNIIIQQFLDSMPRRYEVAEGPSILSGCIITFDPVSKMATSIETIQEHPEESLMDGE